MGAEGTEQALREAEAKYKTLVEQIPAIVYTAEFGQQGARSFVSPQIEPILGFTANDWVADASLWYRRLHPDDRDRAMEEEERSLETFALSSEYRMIARDGHVVWFRDEATVVRDGDDRPLLVQGVMYDITDRKRAEEDLTFLAYHDKLTGLPNRQMFAELIELAVARARRHGLSVAVLYMDLDDFKLVNDTLGHAAGDKLLQQVAMRLREAIRDTDLVARQGGDEFLLLLGDLIPRGVSPLSNEPKLVAEAVAARVAECLQPPFRVSDTDLCVTASIGISLFPESGDGPETLLTQADAVMYESKRSGPGRFLMHTNRAGRAPGRLSLTTRLRRAVDSQQWELHYQPVVDLATRELAGVEALIRWRDPTNGLIAPGEFISLAEELGLISTIGDWVVGELCTQWRAWAEQGLRLRTSFNLSPRQLWQPDLVKKLLGRLDTAGVDPSSIVVEITESAAMVDPDRTQRLLTDLHDAGVGLAIDDFGTGYSSLSRLKNLPVDILKIDQSFVTDAPTDAAAASMIRAIVQLAHNLGIVPLAEGIETAEQLEVLLEHGCTLGQGFYFRRPVPGAEIAAMYGSFAVPL